MEARKIYTEEKTQSFTIGILLIILMQMFQFSVNMTLPLLLQKGLKTSSFLSAMALLPPILMGAVLTPLVGISMSMSTSQTTSLALLPCKNQADGVAIVNTAMQIAGALGSALFVGIMVAY